MGVENVFIVSKIQAKSAEQEYRLTYQGKDLDFKLLSSMATVHQVPMIRGGGKRGRGADDTIPTILGRPAVQVGDIPDVMEALNLEEVNTKTWIDGLKLPALQDKHKTSIILIRIQSKQ